MNKALFFCFNFLLLSNAFAIGESVKCEVPHYPGSKEVSFEPDMSKPNPKNDSYHVTARPIGTELYRWGYAYKELKGSQLRKQRKNLSETSGISEKEIKRVFATSDIYLWEGNEVMQGYDEDAV